MGLDGEGCLVDAMPGRCGRWLLDPKVGRCPAGACRFVAGRWFEAGCRLACACCTGATDLVCFLVTVTALGLCAAAVLCVVPFDGLETCLEAAPPEACPPLRTGFAAFCRAEPPRPSSPVIPDMAAPSLPRERVEASMLPAEAAAVLETGRFDACPAVPTVCLLLAGLLLVSLLLAGLAPEPAAGRLPAGRLLAGCMVCAGACLVAPVLGTVSAGACVTFCGPRTGRGLVVPCAPWRAGPLCAVVPFDATAVRPCAPGRRSRLPASKMGPLLRVPGLCAVCPSVCLVVAEFLALRSLASWRLFARSARWSIC